MAPLLLLCAGAVGCAAGAPSVSGPFADAAAREITAMLDASAEAWNRGDLDGFMDDYAADATFVESGGLIRGAETVRRRYAEGFWSAGAPADALRFEMLDVRVTSPTTATAVGRYILHDRASGEATATGIFTLALGLVDGEWKILHDHSTADT